MKKIFCLNLLAFSLYANNGESIFATNQEHNPQNIIKSSIAVNSNPNYAQNSAQAYEQAEQNLAQEFEQIRQAQEEIKQLQQGRKSKNNSKNNNEDEISANELELIKQAMRNQDLKALQKNFFNKNYSGFENTSEIEFQPNKTHKIRTRFAMATTLIFDSDIDSFIVGDKNFKAEAVPNTPSALVIKPLLIGIDTSLTIFTKDKNIHTFYLYSTDYKSKDNPKFLIHIKSNNQATQDNAEQTNDDYFVIKDGITEVKVKKSDINDNYTQKYKKANSWLVAEEIFSDKKFTYFKYSKDKLPQIPTIFAVIDKQDSPIETRTIGDYIIAETTNPKFTIKSGDSYICVENTQKQTRTQNKANFNTTKSEQK